ncbi:hypothetical protein GJ496_010284 [Pomphorhynchus laevis]|nr:hypothetical protein GJ496_010284 [Pomphorhynchus laevis]
MSQCCRADKLLESKELYFFNDNMDFSANSDPYSKESNIWTPSSTSSEMTDSSTNAASQTMASTEKLQCSFYVLPDSKFLHGFSSEINRDAVSL